MTGAAIDPGLQASIEACVRSEVASALAARTKRLALIAFSGDMDRLMAALIIATGAAAMGMDAAIYFTFWGLAALKKKRVYRGKRITEKMMTALLDSGPGSLPVSRMNMLGLGAGFFRSEMKRKNVQTLPGLLEEARGLGVRLTACQMSMEVMGIRREELCDGVEVGGVATYLEDASEAGLTLFV